MEKNNQPMKILYRSNTNRVLFGVCGGLGEYFDIDPLLFRVLFIALTFGAGSGLLIYLILAFLIPKNPSFEPAPSKTEPVDVKARIHELAAELRELKRSRQGRGNGTARVLLGLIILFIGFGLLAQNLNLFPELHLNFYSLFNFWPVLIILLGLSIISR